MTPRRCIRPEAIVSRVYVESRRRVPRFLSPVEQAILRVILADTLCSAGALEWTRRTAAYLSLWAGCTEDAARKALVRLIRFQLITTRKVGRGREYRPTPLRNWQVVPEFYFPRWNTGTISSGMFEAATSTDAGAIAALSRKGERMRA